MIDRTPDGRRVTATEPAEIPAESLFFGLAAMLPMVAGAAGLFLFDENWQFLLFNLTLFWGGSILTFLAGVRRGVSFRQPGGPQVSQLATMLFLFIAGFGAIVATVWAYPWLAVGLELLGFVALAVFDPISAKHGTAPLYFQKLRPFQMLLPIGSLIAVGIYVWTSPFF